MWLVDYVKCDPDTIFCCTVELARAVKRAKAPHAAAPWLIIQSAQAQSMDVAKNAVHSLALQFASISDLHTFAEDTPACRGSKQAQKFGRL